MSTCGSRRRRSRRPLSTQPAAEPAAQLSPLPTSLTMAKSYAQWQQRLKDCLYSSQTLEILQCVALKEYSRAGETEADFRIRLTQLAREQRDEEVEKLRGRYASKMATLQERIRRAQDTIDREGSEYRRAEGGYGDFGGRFDFRRHLRKKSVQSEEYRPRVVLRARAGRVAREREDVEQARETLDTLLQQRTELEQQIADDVARIDAAFRTDRLQLERLQVRPRKSDITVEPLTLVWMPWLWMRPGLPRLPHRFDDFTRHGGDRFLESSMCHVLKFPVSFCVGTFHAGRCRPGSG